MSILINMEMPESCDDCPLQHSEYLECKITGNNTWEWADDHTTRTIHPKPSDCPLIPVPKHGDLIDRNAILAEQRHLYCENCARRKGMKNGKMKFVYDIGDAPCRACGYGDVLDDIEDAPTIIPAEGGDAE